MRGLRLVIVALLVLAASSQTASAADKAGFAQLKADMDAARLAEVDVFAPKTWQKAIEAFEKAQKDIREHKKQANLDKDVAKAAEFTANATKAADVCQLSLQEYLDPRGRAVKAGGPARVPELYQEAEAQFKKATRKVEEGDVKGALKEAAKSRPLFDTAELEAIRIEILGDADKLIARALADEAEKYAVTTLDKARTARERANTLLTSDRYNRTETVADATLSEYEARHASSIAKSVRSLNRNDQAWEKLMLGYEIQMNRTGAAFGHDHLSFDNGSEAAADELLADTEALQAENQGLKDQLAAVKATLNETLGRMDAAGSGEDPVALADQVDRAVLSLVIARRDLNQQVAAGQDDLAKLAKQQEQVAGELASRRAEESKFRQAKSLLNPSEGQVLYNAANDVVLRLPGLSFGVGKSEIEDKQIGLLTKVQEIIKMYPNRRLVIEGHTDLTGDPQANVSLSEKRAYSVMQYLREAMMIPSDEVRAVGYGADHPVASNKTEAGRAKNRRIDIIVMR